MLFTLCWLCAPLPFFALDLKGYCKNLNASLCTLKNIQKQQDGNGSANLEWFPVIRLHSVVLYCQYESHWDVKGQILLRKQTERIASLIVSASNLALNAFMTVNICEGRVSWIALTSVFTCRVTMQLKYDFLYTCPLYSSHKGWNCLCPNQCNMILWQQHQRCRSFMGLKKMMIQQELVVYQLNDQSPYNPSKECPCEYYGFNTKDKSACLLIKMFSSK